MDQLEHLDVRAALLGDPEERQKYVQLMSEPSVHPAVRALMPRNAPLFARLERSVDEHLVVASPRLEARKR